MILPDTSIWVNHFRSENPWLTKLLNDDSVLIHPLIIAEVAMGSLRDRSETLAYLEILPRVRSARLAEMRALVEKRMLYGRGIGVVDAHLLASVLIHSPTRLWTIDIRLREAAKELGVNANLLEEQQTMA